MKNLQNWVFSWKLKSMFLWLWSWTPWSIEFFFSFFPAFSNKSTLMLYGFIIGKQFVENWTGLESGWSASSENFLSKLSRQAFQSGVGLWMIFTYSHIRLHSFYYIKDVKTSCLTNLLAPKDKSVVKHEDFSLPRRRHIF